jgi:hypothetical protein
MMATTHALVGAALAAGVAVVAPEFAMVALVGGLVGGAAPDLDLYRNHRRRLHFPTYYSMAALLAGLLALAVPVPLTVGVAVALLAAAVHARMDRYGGGLELRPWRGTSTRAVYDHAKGRWYPPKRWIPYDGSPEDLGLAVAVAIPGLLVFDGVAQPVILATVGISAVYVAVRRRLPDLAEALAAALPATVAGHVPDRFRT